MRAPIPAGKNDKKKDFPPAYVCGKSLWMRPDPVLRLHGVECLGELALLVCGAVLVDDALGSGNIDLLARDLVKLLCGSHIVGSNRSAVLLDVGLHLRLEHLILQGLGLGNAHALLRGLDIRHDSFLLIE